MHSLISVLVIIITKKNIFNFQSATDTLILNADNALTKELSGNGKTRFAFQLAKYLCSFCRVAYNSLEEGLSLSIQDAIAQVGMTDGEVKRNFTLLDKESIADIEVRLRHRRAPHVVIIDSVQYTGMTYADYKRLRDNNRHTLFIFINHAGGKEPKGEVAKSIRYDANVKINVEGFKATAQSRYG